MPSASVVGCSDPEVAQFIQDAFMTPNFRIYTNHDVAGVEMGGALKNIIALAAGITEGLGFGDNSKAALMTRGLAEIARLGATCGADVGTFSGLSRRMQQPGGDGGLADVGVGARNEISDAHNGFSSTAYTTWYVAGRPWAWRNCS